MRIRNVAMLLSLPMLVGACGVAGTAFVALPEANVRVESSSPERQTCGILVGDEHRADSAVGRLDAGGRAGVHA